MPVTQGWLLDVPTCKRRLCEGRWAPGPEVAHAMGLGPGPTGRLTQVFCPPGPLRRQLVAALVWRDAGDPDFCSMNTNDVSLREEGREGR